MTHVLRRAGTRGCSLRQSAEEWASSRALPARCQNLRLYSQERPTYVTVHGIVIVLHGDERSKAVLDGVFLPPMVSPFV